MADPTQRLLKKTSTIATTLVAIVIDHFDTDALYWEPEVLREELYALAKGSVPEINLDKIQALTVALTSDLPYYDVPSFNAICNAIGGSQDSVAFELFDPPEPEEMAWAVLEIFLNDPPMDNEKFGERFSPALRKYIGIVLEENAIIRPPKTLAFAELPEPDTELLFGDDPTLYKAYISLQEANKRAVDDYVESRLAQLKAELVGAQLQNGDVDKAIDILEK